MSGYEYLGTSGDMSAGYERTNRIANINTTLARQYNLIRNENSLVEFDHKPLVIPRNRLLLGGGLNPAPGNHLGGSEEAVVKDFKIIRDGTSIGSYKGNLKSTDFRLSLSKRRHNPERQRK